MYLAAVHASIPSVKYLQFGVFAALVVFFHELAPETSMLAAMVVAFGCTVIIFAIPLNIELWLRSRRAKHARPVENTRRQRPP